MVQISVDNWWSSDINCYISVKKKKKREYIRITYMFPKQQDNLVMFVQQFSF